MKYTWILAMVVVLAGLLGPHAADSCGPFFTTMLFTTYHGALPGEFESGRVGVLRPHYYRADLLMAYRTLSGVKLSAGETGRPLDDPPPPAERMKAWVEARKEIASVPAPGEIDPEKRVPGADFQSFPNCLGPAFESAAATLRKRVAQWGAASPNIAEWVRGQDQVFQNCSGGPAIPTELKSGDRALIADRNYQIAAAKFYAGQYADAASAFDKIAADSASPWHDIAPYLAARAFIRQGTMNKDDAKLQAAADRLQAIVKDPGRKQWQAPAQAMLDHVRARTAPQQRLEELAKQLMQPAQGAHLQRVLTDYTAIWDRLDANDGKDFPALQGDVADWIMTFQGQQPAVDQWRAKRTMPWLVAALAATKAPAPLELIAAARAVPPTSPAYASATYWGIRRQILAGDTDAARQWAEQALAAKPPEAAANLFRAERLTAARDWTEFLRYASRMPAATGGIDGDSPATAEDTKDKPVAFDFDSTQPLNKAVPLALWIDASKNTLVPRNLQADIAQAGWVRAILLNDTASARTLAERVALLRPALATEMRAYLAEKDPAAAQFTAVFLMLRGPGFEPVLRPGFNRRTAVMHSDSFRDNWWALNDPPERDGASDPDHEALYDLYPKGNFGPTEFLPKDQRAAGQKEWSQLVEQTGNAVNYLGAQAIAWAQEHGQDPRVPQALYQLVEATHYGPNDGKKGREYSKQAFELLHRKYPNSEWTKKTKYWY